MPATATYEVPATSIFGGTLILDGDRTLERLFLRNATLGGSGTRTITDSFDFRHGTLTGNTSTAIAAGAQLTLSGGQNGAIIISGGHALTIELDSHARWGPTANNIQIQAPGTLINAGTFEIATDAKIVGDGGFVNPGTLRKLSHGVSGIEAPFSSEGAIAVVEGTLEVLGAGLSNGGSVLIHERARLRTTTYSQPALASLEVRVKASPIGIRSGTLEVTTGPLALDGTLVIDADVGVRADEEWRAAIVTGAVERMGEFATVEGLDALPAAEIRYPDDGGVVVRHTP